MSVASSDGILAKSAIIVFPATLVGAWLYHSWSTKKTLILFACAAVAWKGIGTRGMGLEAIPAMSVRQAKLE